MILPEQAEYAKGKVAICKLALDKYPESNPLQFYDFFSVLSEEMDINIVNLAERLAIENYSKQTVYAILWAILRMDSQ